MVEWGYKTGMDVSLLLLLELLLFTEESYPFCSYRYDADGIYFFLSFQMSIRR